MYLALAVIAFVYLNHEALSDYRKLMWLSFCSLLFHQIEEYRLPGTFPGYINSVLGKEAAIPDRYPLNANSALIVNVMLGWGAYLLSAILGESAVWLGLATVIVSAANFMAHTVFFNLRAKTIYNAGMATCWLFFLPVCITFIIVVSRDQLATSGDLISGIALGILFNYFGIYKTINWLKDKNSPYLFPHRNLLPDQRLEQNRS